MSASDISGLLLGYLQSNPEAPTTLKSTSKWHFPQVRGTNIDSKIQQSLSYDRDPQKGTPFLGKPLRPYTTPIESLNALNPKP